MSDVLHLHLIVHLDGPEDLTALARRLTAPSATQPKRPQPRNANQPWTPTADARLAERAAAGATIAELMAEFGRSRGAITSRLDRLVGR
ncbi:hypothetical protein ACIBG8_28330 [Nonomuraea sp. NPDC050556]|uniref:hypothetical protein n=1 Tax=Nonomuraea sp. NPDC050556 TaxID=3364369 RepID=UPI0037BD59C5